MTDRDNWLSLRDNLAQRAEQWAALGHPALLERFVVRNGKPFTPRARIGGGGKAKQCFTNAAHFVLNHKTASYVEGFVVNRTTVWWPIHHAWVTVDGDDAMDPTLQSTDYEYFGVVFDGKTLRHELLVNEVYGILDPGLGMSTALMFKRDPELKSICERIKPTVKFREQR